MKMILDLCLLFCLSPIVFGIYVPSGNLSGKPLATLGIKTIGWQDSGGGSLVIHQNYSGVKLQQHGDAKNLERVYEQNRNRDDFGQQPVDFDRFEEQTQAQMNDGQGLQNFDQVADNEFAASSPTGYQTQHFTKTTVTQSNQNRLYHPPEKYTSYDSTTNRQHKQLNPQNFYSGNRPQSPKQLDSTIYSSCPPGATGQFIFDQSCKQFLNCYKGRGHAQNCAPGTLFNPKTLECDYADKVECVSSVNNLKLDLGPISEKVQASCPRGFSGIIPHYTDCKKFINCANGVEHMMDCAPGTLFNVRSNNCDFPHKAECVGGEGGKSYLAQQLGEGQYSGQNYQTSSGSNYGNNHRQGHKYEQAGSSSNQWQQGTGASGQYQKGSSGSGWNQQHGSSSSWNQQHGGVNWDGNNQLKGASSNWNTNNQGTTSNQQQGATSNWNTNQGTPSHQQGSYQNWNNQGSSTHQGWNANNQNQASSHHFQSSHGFGQNTTQHSEKIIQSGRPKCPAGFTGITEHPFDCKKFLNCANGATYIQDCGPGTVFNPSINACDHPKPHLCGQSARGNQNSLQQGEEKVASGHKWNQQYNSNQQGASTNWNQQQGSGSNWKQGASTDWNQQQGAAVNGKQQGGSSNWNQGEASTWSGSNHQKGAVPNWNNQGTTSHQQQGSSSTSWNQANHQQGSSPKWNQGIHQQGSSSNWNQGTNQQGSSPSWNQGTSQPGSSPSWNQGTGQPGSSSSWNQGTSQPGSSSSWNQGTNQPGSSPSWNQGTSQPGSSSSWNQGTSQPGSSPTWNQGTSQPGSSPSWNQGTSQPESSPSWNQGTSQPGSSSSWNQGTNQEGTSPKWNQGTNQQGSSPNWNQGSSNWNQGSSWKPDQQVSSGSVNQNHGYNAWNQSGAGGQHFGSNQHRQNRTYTETNYDQERQPTSWSWNQQTTPSTWSGQTQPTIFVDQSQYRPQAGGSTTNQASTNRQPGWSINQGHQGHASTNQDGLSKTWNKNQGHVSTNQDVNKNPTNKKNLFGKPNYDQQTHSEDLSEVIENLTNRPPNWVLNRPSKPPVIEGTIEQQSVSKGKSWPPPFPSTDLNADYVFEEDDLDVMMESEMFKPNTVYTTYNAKDWCDVKGFECGNKVCVAPSSVCDGKKDCPNGLDENDCEGAITQFSPTRQTKLAVREVEKTANITIKWCAKICVEQKRLNCKSFNYRKHDGTCFLLDTNVGKTGALIILPNYDYYENKAYQVGCDNGYTCRNKKCISKTQICDGVNDCTDWADEKGCSAEKFGYKIKLAGSKQKNSGRIEIDAFGKSGYICDDMFGLRNADVACRELGFPLGALEVHGNSVFAADLVENDTFYMMDDVSCLGNETTLRDCDFGGWGVHNCRPQEIVGVVCKTPLETCPKDHWKCKTGNECLQTAFVCDGVYDCTDKSDEEQDFCESPIEVRLVNGTSKMNGRVEIRYHGIWGTICDDDFNDEAAKVVCSQLGFRGSGIVKKGGYYGPGNGPIWLDQVFCQGNESKLSSCVHWDWGEHNCDHNEDVGVVCSHQEVINEHPRNIHHAFEEVELLPEKCGFRKDAIFQDEESDVHFRVVQGSVAKAGEYPWQASIRVKGKTTSTHWCGAVVIAKRYVLTAAHCLSGYIKDAYTVFAGDYDVNVNEGTEQEAFIEDFQIHEYFRSGSKMNNDIALIKLKSPGFRFTDAVQPICLPEATFVAEQNANCTISGFGSVESGKARASKQLRAGWIPMQSSEICKMPHVYGEAMTEGMICAGSLDEGVDACDGDSGGPLACLNDGVFTLFGLTSWGQHCGYANKPGVYVKVAHYRNWIEKAMRHM